MAELNTIKIQCAYDRLLPLKECKPHPKNPNKHTSDQIERLAKVIQYQGIRRPIRISKRSGYITSGHGLAKALGKLKVAEVPVSLQDYISDEQEFADLVADNSLQSWSELDLASINLEVPQLGPDFDIDWLGIKDFEIEPADKYGDKNADETPDTRPTSILRGDLFALGSHRLLCGDATSATDVVRLMNDEKADMVYTDPPYGVSYADKNAFLNTIGKTNSIEKEIENDHLTVPEMKNIWDGFLATSAKACHDKASYYISSPQGGELMMMMMMMAINESPWQLKHTIIWVKNNHVLGRSDYNYKHEPILYGWKKNGTHEFFGNGRCKTSVWDFNKPHKNDLHPTMKPVELIEETMANSCKKGGLVFDCFLGSGSTLIACEKTNRRCFGMEIDPQYTDVIIRRWESFTNGKAEILLPDGSKRIWSEVEQDRRQSNKEWVKRR